MEEKHTKIYTDVNKVLVIGDTHFDDVYEGRHKNYYQNTIDVMVQILKVIAERKPDLVVLAGDLIGVRPGKSKVKTRTYLQQIIGFIRSLGKKVIVVKGNHDYAEDSDYDFLSNIGVFTSAKSLLYQVDIVPKDSKPDDRLRIHLRDYGKENLALDIEDNKEGVNIVVAHNEFYIEGREYRRNGAEAIELSKHTPFFGADVILSGHIHEPSPSIEDFTNLEGESTAFINLGCPTRPSYSEQYNQVWFIEFEYKKEKSWDFNPIVIDLVPSDKIFNKKNELFEEVENQILNFDKQRRLDLDTVMTTLLEMGPNTLNIREQIRRIPAVREKAREKAIEYIELASRED